MRRFSLAEVAVVVVIVGILAALSITVTCGLTNDSKWSEAKSAAGTLRQSLDVYKARHLGTLEGLTSSSAADPAFLSAIKLANAFDNLRYFAPANLRVVILPKGHYHVIVLPDRTAVADSPLGFYLIDDEGNELDGTVSE